MRTTSFPEISFLLLEQLLVIDLVFGIWCFVTTFFTMCVRVASPISRGTTTCTTTKD